MPRFNFANAALGHGERSPRGGAPLSVPRPYHGSPLTRVDSDAGPLWVQASDGVILPYIAHNGTWEPDEGTLLKSLLRPGMVFVDVGANIGYFSRLIATHCEPAAIHAFEPHPDLVGVLELNVWGLTPPVHVWPVALGDTNGTVTIESAPHNVGDSRVSLNGTSSASMISGIARMDDLVNGPVDVVKIDVQGFESDVLRGMQRIVRENRAIKLVVEFWPRALRDRQLTPIDILDQYREMGLVVRLVRSGVPIDTTSREVLNFCMAGPSGQANLLLSHD